MGMFGSFQAGDESRIIFSSSVGRISVDSTSIVTSGAPSKESPVSEKIGVQGQDSPPGASGKAKNQEQLLI